MLADAGVATDQAARAARFALDLRKELPGVPMALATGRGDVKRRVPVGDTIDRAANLLVGRAEAVISAARAGLPPPSPIAVDDVTAALLGTRFTVREGAGGLSLEGVGEDEAGARRLLGQVFPMMGRDWELSSIESLFMECIGRAAGAPRPGHGRRRAWASRGWGRRSSPRFAAACRASTCGRAAAIRCAPARR